MSDDLKPALSAARWNDVLSGNGLSPYLVDSRAIEVANIDGPDKAIALALANHALPDDSPYKITRADVDALSSDTGPSEAFLSRLAANLAALLPAETP